jgi:photosystem II stability/assembly factor-like uncharacterized protein
MKQISLYGLLIVFALTAVMNPVYAQWKQAAAFPSGSGNIYGLAFSGSNIFVITSNGGSLKSTVGGNNWTDNNDNLIIPFTDYRPQLFCIYATGSNLLCGTSDGVYMTGNTGGSWTRMYEGMMDESFRYPAIYAITQNSTHVFAGASYFNGMYVSTNGGASWAIKNSGLSANLDIFSMTVMDNVVYAGTDKGIFKSSDNGNAWVSASRGLPESYNIFGIAVIGSKLFAATNGAGVYMSDDQGDKWIASNDGLSCLMLSSIVSSGDDLYAGHDFGVAASSDEGANWFDVNVDLPDDAYVLSLGITGKDLYAAVGGGEVWYLNIDEVTVKSSAQKPAVQIPFNVCCSNGITVRFTFPGTQHVRLNMVDLSGKRIAALADAVFTAGSHEVRVPRPDIAPGFYVLQMQLPSGVIARRIALTQ